MKTVVSRDQVQGDFVKTDFSDDYLERAPQIAMISGYRKFLPL